MSTFADHLVVTYLERIGAYVRLRVAPQDCEDLIADIFLRAISRAKQLHGAEAPWLFAIARSRVADHYRRKGERPAPYASQQGDPLADAANADLEPLARLEAAEFQACLRRHMSRLGEIERDAVALKFCEGLTNIQIAGLLKITPNHLGVVLHRALGRLREAMLAERGVAALR